jgi:hypothetical protein
MGKRRRSNPEYGMGLIMLIVTAAAIIVAVAGR